MIHGEQIALRLIEEDDLTLLARWYNNVQLPPIFYRRPLVSDFGQKNWYDALISDPTRMQFTVVQLADSFPVGSVGLQRIDYRNQNAEVVPLVADPSKDFSEFAADAIKVMINYAFRDLNLQRLFIELTNSHQDARHTATEIGFKAEGIYRKAAFTNGEYEDVHLLAVLREEWPVAQALRLKR